METCFSVTLRTEEFDAPKGEKNEKVLFCVGRADLALRARQGEIFKESASHHFFCGKKIMFNRNTLHCRCRHLEKNSEGIGTRNGSQLHDGEI